MKSALRPFAAATLALFTTAAYAQDVAPVIDNTICTEPEINLSFADNMAELDMLVLLDGLNHALEGKTSPTTIKNDTYVVGPDAGKDPLEVTTGHTFLHMEVQQNGVTVQSVYGAFNNGTGTMCAVSAETFGKFKPAAPAP